MAIHPFQREPSHLWQFFVAAVEQLDPAIFSLAVFRIERRQMVAHAFDARRRRQRVVSPVQAEMRARNDQFVDLSSRKMLDRKSTRLNSSHLGISYAVFC